MAKKTKKKGHRKQAGPPQAVQDELLALEAIYGDAEGGVGACHRDEDDNGFQLRVVPYPAGGGQNNTWCDIHVRLDHGYPHNPIGLKVERTEGLSIKDTRSLSKLLHTHAEASARQDAVCAFDLVNACQEFLREHNDAPHRGATAPSLWHEMLQRSDAKADSSEADEDGGGLELPMQDDGFFAATDEKTARLTAQRRRQLDASAGASTQQQQQPQQDQQQQQSMFMQRMHQAQLSAQPLGFDQAVAAVTTTEKDALAEPSTVISSVISAMRSSLSAIRRALPASLWRILDVTEPYQHLDDQASERSSMGTRGQGLDGTEPDEDERAVLKRDLLAGHLLSMAFQDRSRLPPHAMPSIAAHLRQRSLLQPWVERLLLTQPELFNRAFQRLFAQDVDAARREGYEPSISSALGRFWTRERLLSVSDGAAQPQATAKDRRSRYELDFQELRVLGRGGFGLVVAAINRLDGRQYAVKKIPLDATTPAAFNRIIREVSTLSRLQHPHVVRYFQAWVEVEDANKLPRTAGGHDNVSEDWLDSSSGKAAPNVSAEVAARRRQHPSAAPGLHSVIESSDEAASSQQPSSSEADGSSSWGLAMDPTGSAVSRKQLQAFAAQTSTTSDVTSDRANSEPHNALFIQMEFCPRTLKDVLDEGLLLDEHGEIDDAACWQILRQILAGLSYIHAAGTIHRDLKPDNIFFDALRNDIKLGDFGLSKYTAAGGVTAMPEELGAALTARAQIYETDGATSGIVGTSAYISPEIEKGWATYDERVDIYSLGVVVFELWYPFKTGMERAEKLRVLRETGTLPRGFEDSRPKVASLIQLMMSHNPADRPSARVLLRSDYLPPTVADEAVSDLLRSLPDDPDTLERVVDAIFNLPISTAQATVAQDEPGAPSNVQVNTRENVLSVISEVFALHGAVRMSSFDLGTVSGAADVPAGMSVVLMQDGNRAALRYEMRRPFAGWLVRQAQRASQSGESLEAMRRYEIAHVWRQTAGVGIPSSFLQADFDIVGQGGSQKEHTLADAEVIKAIVEILSSLPGCGALEVRLGHRALYEAALRHIATPRELRGAVAKLLATAAAVSPLNPTARGRRWPSIRSGLEGLGLDEAAVSRCKALVLQAPGEAAAALHRLRASAGIGGRAAFVPPTACLDDLQVLLKHLATWGVTAWNIILDPLLLPHAEYFSGLTFQAHLVQSDSGAASLVAVGGRYDGLLKALWVPAPSAQLGGPMTAVGITINAERLAAVVQAQAQEQRSYRDSNVVCSSQADVLVCSRGGGGMLTERMQLVSQLWAAGIRAETMHLLSPSTTAQYDYARTRGFVYLVTIEYQAHIDVTNSIVLVKALGRRAADEYGVPYDEIVRHVQSLLHKGSAGILRAAVQRQESLGVRSSSLAGTLQSLEADTDGTEQEDARPASWRERRRNRNK